MANKIYSKHHNSKQVFQHRQFLQRMLYKTILELNIVTNKNIIYFNLFQLHTRYPHFFPQSVTWLNKYQIQNHLSGTKLHLACLQIQNLFLHFTKARYVMFPENHCTTRHLLNIVWKRLQSLCNMNNIKFLHAIINLKIAPDLSRKLYFSTYWTVKKLTNRH